MTAAWMRRIKAIILRLAEIKNSAFAVRQQHTES
jgi:hypothetical protein